MNFVVAIPMCAGHEGLLCHCSLALTIFRIFWLKHRPDIADSGVS